MRATNLGNPNRQALDRNSDAAAFVIGTYGISTTGINGVPDRAERAAARSGAVAVAVGRADGHAAA